MNRPIFSQSRWNYKMKIKYLLAVSCLIHHLRLARPKTFFIYHGGGDSESLFPPLHGEVFISKSPHCPNYACPANDMCISMNKIKSKMCSRVQENWYLIIPKVIQIRLLCENINNYMYLLFLSQSVSFCDCWVYSSTCTDINHIFYAYLQN